MPGESSLSGKVAVITGASSGIGRAIAIRLASSGSFLAITGRDVSNLELTKQQCIEKGLNPDNVLVIQSDLMKNEDVAKIANMTLEKYQKVDFLIPNAGFFNMGPIESFPMEDYHALMQVNLHSVVYLTKLLVPHLEKTKGVIVNISSNVGVAAGEGVCHYAMTKAALDQFCHCLALDLGPKGIRVNNVNPAVIITDIHKRFGMSEEVYKAYLEQGKISHSLARVGNPEEVASVVEFLVSEKSQYTSGASILVDGGRNVMYYPYKPYAQ